MRKHTGSLWSKILTPRRFRDSSATVPTCWLIQKDQVSRKCRGTCPCPVSGSCLPPLKSLLSVGMDHSCQFLLAFVCFAAFWVWFILTQHVSAPFLKFPGCFAWFSSVVLCFHNLYTFYLVLHAFHVIFDGFAMFLYISACFRWI